MFLPCLLAAVFAGGLFYAQWRTPVQPEKPSWAVLAVTPDVAGSLYTTGLDLTGIVAEVDGITDRRLRILLEDVRPKNTDSFTNAHIPLPGRLVLTWHSPPTIEGNRKSAAEFAYRRNQDINPETARIMRPGKGQKLELRLRLREVRGLANPGLLDMEAYWQDQNVWFRADEYETHSNVVVLGEPALLQKWRESLRAGVIAALPKTSSGEVLPGAGFIPALLFGDRFLLDNSEIELLSKATLSHSLALSGMHLGYAAAVGYALGKLIFSCFPALGLWMPRKKFLLCLAIVPVVGYLWLGGASPSLLRSALMLFFWGILLFTARPAVLLDGLLWALTAMLLFNPLVFFDLRLQLSASAIFAIVLASPLLSFCNATVKEWIGGYSLPRRLLARICSSMLYTAGVSLAVQIALMPLLLKTFGYIGLVFPLNLLWLPVLGLVVMPACFFGLAATALYPPAAELIFSIAVMPCGWLMGLLNLLEADFLPVVVPARPHWLFMVGYLLILVSLPRICTSLNNGLHKPHVFALPLTGLILCLAPLGMNYYEQQQDIVRLRVLDVGQAQAILLEWKGGGRLLLDGGGGTSPRFDVGREVVTAILADGRWPRLEYMLATHPDTDHVQGLLYPLEHIRVDYYADNGDTGTGNAYVKLHGLLTGKGLTANHLFAGQRLELSTDLALEILHPPKNETRGGNNSALVTRLVWKNHPLALICGDIELAGQARMLGRYKSNPESIERSFAAEVLLIPHHGSKGAMSARLYQAVSPRLAIASCGYGNRWNFPSSAVVKQLEEMRIPLLSTAHHGQITLEWRSPASGAAVKTARPCRNAGL